MARGSKASSCCGKQARATTPTCIVRPMRPHTERGEGLGSNSQVCELPPWRPLGRETSSWSSGSVGCDCNMNLQLGTNSSPSCPLENQRKRAIPVSFRAAVLAVSFASRISQASASNSLSTDQHSRVVGQQRSFLEVIHSLSGRLSQTETTTSTREKVAQLMDLLEPGQPLAHFSDFAKEYGDANYCRRLVTKYQDDMQKCSYQLKQALIWREQHKELLTTRRCTQAGDYRVLGADLAGRPVLYMCMKNQLSSMGRAIDHLIVCMLQSIDNMPAGVESATHIWDLHGMMIYLNLNPSPLIQILKMAEGYFAERMQELIIVDMPRMATFLKDAAWPVVPEKTRNKIKFMTPEQAKQNMQILFAPETSLRIAACMDQNRDQKLSLEDRQRTWMRVDKHGELVPAFL
eukprot:CAMPEP_0183400674 /NCGR_PEP_ID=MMETSP0370-20130417/12750_1 /TAXON_ID=268820 /ORGANISM="Peridinium aciculiferum, Strain PAER-2" /LENGTH=403 /DNA_ID=CAMNT_0025582007 /DNA_START=57 /DNA_END=1268 /DNA_ORIENTATION=-